MLCTHKDVDTQGRTRTRAHQDPQVRVFTTRCPGHGRKVAPHRSHGTRRLGKSSCRSRRRHCRITPPVHEWSSSRATALTLALGWCVIRTSKCLKRTVTSSRSGAGRAEAQGAHTAATGHSLRARQQSVIRMKGEEACIPACPSPDALHRRPQGNMVCMPLNTQPAPRPPKDSPHHAAH